MVEYNIKLRTKTRPDTKFTLNKLLIIPVLTYGSGKWTMTDKRSSISIHRNEVSTRLFEYDIGYKKTCNEMSNWKYPPGTCLQN